MYCTNCGKELPVDARFCTECGAKVEIEKAKVIESIESNDEVDNDINATYKTVVETEETSDFNKKSVVSESDSIQEKSDANIETDKHPAAKNPEKTTNSQFFISANGQINNKQTGLMSKIIDLSVTKKIIAVSMLIAVAAIIAVLSLINGSSNIEKNGLIIKSDNNTGAAFNLSLDDFNTKFNEYIVKTYNENCSLDISKLWEHPVQQTEEGSGVLYSSYSSKLMKQSEYINGVSLTANVADRHIIDFQISIDEYELDNAACYKCWQNLSFLTFGTCGNLSSGELTTIMSELNKNRNIAKTVLKDNIAYTFFYNKEDECYVFQAFPVTNKYKKTYENEFLDFKKLDKIESSDEKTTTQEIDVFKNIDIDVDGSNGYATAQLSFPYDYNVDFGGVRFSEYNNSYDSVNVYFGDEKIGFVLFKFDKNENLSNGEKIKLSFEADDDMPVFLKLAGYYFKSESKEITVSGLKEATSVDLLSEIEKYIKYWGANGDGEASIEIPEGTTININVQEVYFVYSESNGKTVAVFDVISDNTSLGEIRVKLDGNTNHLSSGEIIKLVIDPESSGYSEVMKKDIRFKEDEKEIVVPEMGFYVNSKDELNSRDIKVLKKMALDALKESSSQDLYKDYKVEQVNFRTIKPTAVNNYRAKGYVEVIAKKGNDKIHILLFDVVKNNEGVMGYCDSGFVFELEDNFKNNIFNRMNGIEDPGANYTSEKIG